MWIDDDTGYELSNPKHPSFHEQAARRADDDRKRAREMPPVCQLFVYVGSGMRVRCSLERGHSGWCR